MTDPKPPTLREAAEETCKYLHDLRLATTPEGVWPAVCDARLMAVHDALLLALSQEDPTPPDFAAALARAEKAEAMRDEAVELIVEILNQACLLQSGEHRAGVVDSMALRSYADGLRFLASRGRFEIESEAGRRVIGRFVGPPPSGEGKGKP